MDLALCGRVTRRILCVLGSSMAFVMGLLGWLPGIAAADTALAVRWQDVPGAAGYRLVLKGVSSGYFRTVDTGSAPAPAPGLRQWIVAGMPDRHDVQVEVQARDSVGRLGPPSRALRIDAEEVAWLRDSDGDGLADAIEDLDGNGRVGVDESDPYAADSDGDGRADGEELWRGTSPNVRSTERTSPVCGDGEIDEAEQCEVGSDFACPGACLEDCLCAGAVSLPPGREALPLNAVLGSEPDVPLTFARMAWRWQPGPDAAVLVRLRSKNGRTHRLRYVAEPGIDRTSPSRAEVRLGTPHAKATTHLRDPLADAARLFGRHDLELVEVSASEDAGVKSLFVVPVEGALEDFGARSVELATRVDDVARVRIPRRGRMAVEGSGVVFEGVGEISHVEFELHAVDGRRFRLAYGAGVPVRVQGARARLPLVRQGGAASSIAFFPLSADLLRHFGETVDFHVARVRLDGEVGRMRFLPAPSI